MYACMTITIISIHVIIIIQCGQLQLTKLLFIMKHSVFYVCNLVSLSFMINSLIKSKYNFFSSFRATVEYHCETIIS